MKNYLKKIASFTFDLGFMPILIVAIALFKIHSVSAANHHQNQKSYYEFQAELTINFIKHVSWSDTAKNGNKAICVINESPFLTKLKFFIKEKNIKNIQIILKNENDYLGDCNALVINEDYSGYLEKLLYKTKNKSILTIGYIDNFVKKGGMVELCYKYRRVEIKIDPIKIKESNFKIDPSIIAVSRID